METPALFAVVGKPVLHSRSPQMHNAAFKALGMDSVYTRLAAESADDAIRTARTMGIRGMNVTSPFKEEMAAIVEAGDDAVRKLGAVNTVLFKNGKTIGYNTDPDGVSGALQAIKVKGCNAVVLGAGGAAKAAVLALKSMRAGKITVVNRTHGKARQIADEFDCASSVISELSDAMNDATVVISALSTLEKVVDCKSLHDGMTILDANYSAESALTKDAKKAGCKTIDGREWLLYQGVRAFGLFSGRKAPVSAMRKAVYARSTNARTRNPKPKTQNPKPETGNIALVGMMGSGKDATANALGRASGMGAVDVDAEIERKAGKKIKDIFASEGEERFRRMESEEIMTITNARNKIVNCGGGAILKQQNRRTLNRNALVVWLWARPKVMVSRVAGDDSRPLLHVPDQEKETILARLLDNRKRFYAETADFVLDTSDRSPEEIAGRILYETDKARSD